jgi:hypothetical protein
MATNPNSPETIDVNMSLMDADAMSAFTKEMNSLNGLMGQIKGLLSGGSSDIPSIGGGTGGPSTPSAGEDRSYESSISSKRGSVAGGGRAPVANPGGGYGAQDVYDASGRSVGLNMYANDDPSTTLLSHATNFPVVGRAISPFLDDQGAFRMENIGQAAAFSIGSAISNNVGSGLNMASSLINPFGMAQAGYAQNLSGGDITQIGPFGFRNPFGGEAFSGRASQIGQALPALLQGGIGFNQALQIGQSWGELGYKPQQTDYNRLEDLQSRIVQSDPRLGALSDNGTLTPIIDQMVRHGTTSFDDIQKSFTELSDAAAGARINLDEMAQGAASVAEGLTNRGLTYQQGFQAASDFTASTNQHPDVMAALMDNPIWQMQAMGQTRIPVQMQGLIAQHPGVFNQITSDTFKQMEATLSGAPATQSITGLGGVQIKIPARRQAETAAANAMGLSIDTYREMKSQSRISELQGSLQEYSQMYDREVDRLGKQYGQGTPAYQQHLSQLYQGTGQYGKGQVSWDLIQRLAERPQSGISPEKLADLSQMNPADRGEALHKYIAAAASNRTAADSSKHLISFTGMAEKVLKEVLPGYDEKIQARRDANRGLATTIAPYLSSGVNNPAGLLNSDTDPSPSSALDNAADEAGNIISNIPLPHFF